MVTHYKEHVKAMEGGSSVMKWTVATCKEFIKAESGITMIAKGELTCERRFCVWATDRVCFICLLHPMLDIM